MSETGANKVPYLQMKNISKSFHGVHALKGVEIAAEKGQVTSLCGENGAGKSTLIKVLGGIHKMDAGEIYIDGQLVDIDGPAKAKELGIAIIHQELNDIPNLSIAENLFVGKEVKKGLFVDKSYYRERAKEMLRLVDMNVDPDTLVRFLSTAQKQLVEILRAINAEARIIVMDEPTSSLTSKETEKLFEIIDILKERGVAILYISHRMDEILRISDTVTVFRDGTYIGTLDKTGMTEEEIIRMMVGRELTELYNKVDTKIGDVVLECKNICSGFVRNVDFSVRAGEIVGFSGLVGAGRTETMRVVFGIDKPDSGEIFIDGRKVNITCPADAIRLGIGLVPEDRKMQALVLGMTVKENTTLVALKDLKKGIFYDGKKEAEVAQEYVDKLKTKTPSIDQKVKNLSGGNQQKVVLSKWLLTNPRILILDEPTRGIDVGAKKEIHDLMCELAAQGVAIIMISSELPEVIGMSDRIVIMHEGRKKGEIPGKGATQEQIMKIAYSKEEA